MTALRFIFRSAVIYIEAERSANFLHWRGDLAEPPQTVILCKLSIKDVILLE